MNFKPANTSGPFGTATAYRVSQGTKTADIAKRDDGRWWLSFGGQEKRLGRKASFPSAQRALRTMGW